MPGEQRMGFDRFARWTEHQVGSPISFAVAVAVIVLWAVSGPFFGWSDTWQLVINTGTTIITFLMVFLNSEHAEPRHSRPPPEARRADPRQQDGSQLAPEP